MTNLTDKYNRNRPFLMIIRSAKVAKEVKTEVAGWSKQANNMNVSETFKITDRVNDSHLREAIVIIDVVNNVCIKNAITESPDNEVISHFLSKYKKDVSRSLDAWATYKAQEKAAQPVVKQSVDGVYGI